MAADRRKSSGPRWLAILENIESQNRTALEHLETTRISLEQRIDRLDQDTRMRDAALETALRELNRKFDTFAVPLEARVAAIEKRLG